MQHTTALPDPHHAFLRVNVYERLWEAENNISDDLGFRYPLFLRRNSWDHPRSLFLVVGTVPDFKDWAIRPPPYYSGPDHSKVAVYGVMCVQGVYQADFLRCPGTYAYHAEPQPDWWNPPDVRVRLTSRDAFRVYGKKHEFGSGYVEFSLRAEMHDGDE